MEKQIEIWSTESSDNKKAALPKFGKATTKIYSTYVEVSTLSENLNEFLVEFQKVLEKQPKSKSGYEIDEIELSLGVNAKGGISLLGKLEAGVEAGIKVKLKKKNSN